MLLLGCFYASSLNASNCGKLLGGEWGPINHVIVGNPAGAHFPHEEASLLKATLPGGATLRHILQNQGRPFDSALVGKAEKEIQGFIARLNEIGVKTSQPKFSEDHFAQPILKADFQTKSGLYAAMPRDNLLLLPPNLVILSPMAWRSRQNEHAAYANVVQELQSLGLKVIEAPRPQLNDSTYVKNWHERSDGKFRSVINNHEPLFDAADFIRFGNHIVGQLSHVTNRKGVEWIRSVLDPKYHLHIVEFDDAHPMHIDATIMPLSLGKLLVHPDRVPTSLQKILRETLFSEWEFIEAPRPSEDRREAPLYFTSRWINMNMLVGANWAFTEARDQGMAQLLNKHGIEAIPVAFQNFQALGGSFHCATLDIRQRTQTQFDEDTQALGEIEDTYFYRNVEGEYKTKPLWE